MRLNNEIIRRLNDLTQNFSYTGAEKIRIFSEEIRRLSHQGPATDVLFDDEKDCKARFKALLYKQDGDPLDSFLKNNLHGFRDSKSEQTALVFMADSGANPYSLYALNLVSRLFYLLRDGSILLRLSGNRHYTEAARDEEKRLVINCFSVDYEKRLYTTFNYVHFKNFDDFYKFLNKIKPSMALPETATADEADKVDDEYSSGSIAPGRGPGRG